MQLMIDYIDNLRSLANDSEFGVTSMCGRQKFITQLIGSDDAKTMNSSSVKKNKVDIDVNTTRSPLNSSSLKVANGFPEDDTRSCFTQDESFITRCKAVLSAGEPFDTQIPKDLDRLILS